MKTINDYTIYCTPEQTKKALELGAPIYVYDKMNSDAIRELDVTLENKVEFDNGLYAEIPTAEQLIGWLEEQGIWISILYGYEVIDKWAFDLDGEKYIDYISGEFNSRKEAILAAIDAALDYLEKQNK